MSNRTVRLPSARSVAAPHRRRDPQHGRRPRGAAGGRVAAERDLAPRLRLVDGFELTCAGELVRLPVGAQRLLAFLALEERPQPRMHVAFVLWAGASEAHAYGSLRSAIFRVRARGDRLVLASKDELELAPDVSVDVRERSALANRLLDAEEIELDPVVLGGELLPHWYEDWVIVHGKRYHELRLRALAALCDRELRAARLPQAVAAGQAAVRADPLRDSARRALIRAHLAEGDTAEALAQFRDFERRLRELGLRPSNEMIELVHAVTRQ